MKKSTCVITSIIWTAMVLCLCLLWVSELRHWGEISSHLKTNLVMFMVFMPLVSQRNIML